jgi:hypothetical protein
MKSRSLNIVISYYRYSLFEKCILCTIKYFKKILQLVYFKKIDSVRFDKFENTSPKESS